MSNAKLEGAKTLLGIEELGFNKKKHQGEMAIKRAELLGKNSSMTETMGDVALAQVNSMAGRPKNIWNGVAEGLLTAFGMHLKGKSAEEKKQTIENALEAYDWMTQAQAFADHTKQTLQKEKEVFATVPSEKQAMQAWEDGTLEQTMKVALKQKGVNPENVMLSSDGSTVFIEQPDGTINKEPIQNFLSPEDSQQFAFLNKMQKANLAKAENKQLQGLAQDNMDLRRMIEEGIREGEIIEKKKLDNETMTAEARGLSANASMKRANNEVTNMPKMLELREGELEVSQQNANTRASTLGFKNLKDIMPALQSIDKTRHIIKEVKADIKNYPEIFNSSMSAWINTKGDSGAFSLWVQNHLPTVSEDKKDAFQRVSKNLNQLMVSEVRGLGNRNNMTVDKWLQSGNVNMQFSPKNANYMLSQLDNEMSFFEKQYDRALNHTGGSFIGDARRDLKPVFESESDKTRETMSGAGQGSGVRNTITLLKDGKTKTIPTSDYAKSKELAKQQGFGVVE